MSLGIHGELEAVQYCIEDYKGGGFGFQKKPWSYHYLVEYINKVLSVKGLPYSLIDDSVDDNIMIRLGSDGSGVVNPKDFHGRYFKTPLLALRFLLRCVQRLIK